MLSVRVARNFDFFVVLHDHVMQSREVIPHFENDESGSKKIVVCSCFTMKPDIDELFLVHIKNSSSVVVDMRIFGDFSNKLPTSGEISAHLIQEGRGFAFNISNLRQCFLLNTNTEIISVFDTRNQKSNPHFHGVALLDGITKLWTYEIH